MQWDVTRCVICKSNNVDYPNNKEESYKNFSIDVIQWSLQCKQKNTEQNFEEWYERVGHMFIAFNIFIIILLAGALWPIHLYIC